MHEFPHTELTTFLRAAQEPLHAGEPVEFVHPKSFLVLNCCDYLRERRLLKFDFICHAVEFISMGCFDAGAKPFGRNFHLNEFFDGVDKDKKDRTNLLLHEKDLSAICGTIWNSSQPDNKMAHIWARFLFQFAAVPRSVNVIWMKNTAECCPLIAAFNARKARGMTVRMAC